MALTKLKLVKDDAPIGSSLRLLLKQHNLVAAQMLAICTALDADAGTIDNDYASSFEADATRLLSSAGTNTTIAA